MKNFLFIRNKIPISTSRFVLLLATVNTFLFNGALFLFLNSQLDLLSYNGLLIAATVVSIIFLGNCFVISFVGIIAKFALKPLFILTAIVNSIAFYYMFSYQVVLDKSMIGNILNTRMSESNDLLAPVIALYVILLGILPSYFVLKFQVGNKSKRRIIINLALIVFACTAFIFVNSASWLWIDKYSKVIGGKILPWSYIINTARIYIEKSESKRIQTLLPDGDLIDDNKTTVVLIIGETARAANFSLYGYERNTNPRLQAEKLIIFDKTKACSTYTTASIACMLSYNTRDKNVEPLPSYLTRLGVNVIWRTSNWGEPKINVSTYRDRTELKESCIGNDCRFDEILLSELKDEIETSKSNKNLIVLHTKGSHGPSYYSRYPSEFEVFKPVCRFEEIRKCTTEELINAYDNTIVYTDYFIHRTIRILESLSDEAIALIYISDHGESLGEKGFYLHGTPYGIAPDFQKEIPFVIWRSAELISQQEIEDTEIQQTGDFSHANIAHTISGILNVATPAYDASLDIFNNSLNSNHKLANTLRDDLAH